MGPAPAGRSVEQGTREGHRPELMGAGYPIRSPALRPPLTTRPHSQALTPPWQQCLRGGQAHRLQHEGSSGVRGARIHPKILPTGQDLPLTAVLAKTQALQRPSLTAPHPHPRPGPEPVQGAVVLLHLIQGHQGHWQKGDDDNLLHRGREWVSRGLWVGTPLG